MTRSQTLNELLILKGKDFGSMTIITLQPKLKDTLGSEERTQ